MRKDEELRMRVDKISVPAPGNTRVNIASVYGVLPPDGRVDMQTVIELRDVIRATPQYRHPGKAKRLSR